MVYVWKCLHHRRSNLQDRSISDFCPPLWGNITQLRFFIRKHVLWCTFIPASLKKIGILRFELFEVKLCKQSAYVTHCRHVVVNFLSFFHSNVKDTVLELRPLMYWGIGYRYRYRSNFRVSFSFRFRTGRRQSGSTHDSDHAECWTSNRRSTAVRSKSTPEINQTVSLP